MSVCEVFDRFRRAAPLDPEDRSYILAVLLSVTTALQTDWSLDASMAFWTLMVHM